MIAITINFLHQPWIGAVPFCAVCTPRVVLSGRINRCYNNDFFFNVACTTQSTQLRITHRHRYVDFWMAHLDKWRSCATLALWRSNRLIGTANKWRPHSSMSNFFMNRIYSQLLCVYLSLFFTCPRWSPDIMTMSLIILKGTDGTENNNSWMIC